MWDLHQKMMGKGFPWISLLSFALIIRETGSTRCYTDSCQPDDSACLRSSDTCEGKLCFLDITGQNSSYKRINRGCLDGEFLKDEGDGCFLINSELKRYFCQCRTDLCNGQLDLDTVTRVGGGRNISCDTGCGPVRQVVVQRGREGRRRRPFRKGGTVVREKCKGKINGPLCSYDPQNRGIPMAEYGESYYTPFGSFYGWPEPNSTVCIRYTFPPFYFIRDAACFCDTDNCHKSPNRSAMGDQSIDGGKLVTCHGCFLDCNGIGEFCGPQDMICHNDTTCRGHYCVLHSVIDRLTGDGSDRLAVLSQYCMNTTKLLNGSRHQMTFESGRNGQTRVIVCNDQDYCNAFNFTGFIVGEQPQAVVGDGQGNTTATINNLHVSTPNTGRMIKLRKLLNYLLESLLSPNNPW